MNATEEVHLMTHDMDVAKHRMEMLRILKYMPVMSKPASQYDPMLLQRLGALPLVRDLDKDFDK